MEFYKIYISYF